MGILAIDIGNTALKWAVFRPASIEAHPVQQGYYSHHNEWSTASPDNPMGNALDPVSLDTPLACIVVCSVVPAGTSSVATYCQHRWPKATLLVITPQDTPTLTLGGYNPHTLGPDRWVNLVAAQAQYPNDTVIIVDSGTATTIDVLEATAKGQHCFKGGLILPGFEAFVASLTQKTALLPNTGVDLAPLETVPLLGLSTVAGLQSGLGHGYKAMLVGLLQALTVEYPQAKLLLTGGLGPSLLPQLQALFGSRVSHDPLVTLRGCALSAVIKR
jgi:type III pantothenate kinase